MKKAKTICFISKYATWQDYRAEVMTYLGRRYQTHVEMLTTGRLQPYLKNNETMRYHFFRSWIPLSAEKYGFFPGAVWHIIKSRPHAVLCQNDTRQFTEYLAFIVCKILGIRFVWWTHSHMPSVFYRSRMRKWLRQKYALFFLKKADAVITYCPVGRQYLLDNRLEENRVICAPNTLNTDALQYLAKKIRHEFSQEELREKLGLPAADHFLLYMGRLTERKNIQIAIQLVSQLSDRMDEEYHLVIIGDGLCRGYLESLAHDIAPGKVSFTGAVFENSLKALYFSVADLFIIPGAVGLALNYAFAFRLPVLTTKFPHHGPEIIYLKHGENGFLCSEGNIDEMVECTAKILRDPVRYKVMAEQAEKTLLEKASIQLMTARMAKALAI